jgi:hypothetical protein
MTRISQLSVTVAVGAVVLLAIALGAGMQLSGQTDTKPTAGAAYSSTGPGCITDGSRTDNGTLRTLPQTEGSGVLFAFTVAHNRGHDVNIDLDYVRRGHYRLTVRTEPRNTPDATSSKTRTPQLVESGCQIATRINGSGRMSPPVDTLEVTVNGEQLMEIDVPDREKAWEFPNVINATTQRSP